MLKRIRGWLARRRLARLQARCSHENQYAMTLPIDEPAGVRWATNIVTCDDCGRVWRQVIPAPPDGAPVEAYRYKGVWEERRVTRTGSGPLARPRNGGA